MVKGCQREMIQFKTRESEIFESAWLVLRRGRGEKSAADMLAEANRIIGTADERRKRGRVQRGSVLAFLAGLLAGGGLVVLLVLLLF